MFGRLHSDNATSHCFREEHSSSNLCCSGLPKTEKQLLRVTDTLFFQLASEQKFL